MKTFKKVGVLLLILLMLVGCQQEKKSSNKSLYDRLITMQNKFSKLESVEMDYTLRFQGSVTHMKETIPFGVVANLNSLVKNTPHESMNTLSVYIKHKDLKDSDTFNASVYTKENSDKSITVQTNFYDEEYEEAVLPINQYELATETMPTPKLLENTLKILLESQDNVVSESNRVMIGNTPTTEIGVEVTLETLVKILKQFPQSNGINDLKLEELSLDAKSVLVLIKLNLTDGNELKKLQIDFSQLNSLLKQEDVNLDDLIFEITFDKYNRVTDIIPPMESSQ